MNKFDFYLLSLNRYKFIVKIKRTMSSLAMLLIHIKRLFHKLKPVSKKRRLFSTTGNLSLLNALTIIKQLHEENCEDYLIIDSFQGGYNFWKNNCEIAKLHNFKGIKCIYNMNFLRELKLTLWDNFDEIFMLNHPVCIPPILKMYPNSEINLFDEGCGSLVVNLNIINEIKNLKHFYTHKYINKIDYFGFSKEITNKIYNLDPNIFRQITSEIKEKFPILTPYNKSDKNILYCSIYWQASGLSEEQFVKEQLKQIKELINAGYKILYKPHPRDTKFYGLDTDPNVTFISTTLPVEIYDWDILALTGMNCTSLINLPHYHNIPAFSNILTKVSNCDKNNKADNVLTEAMKIYSPNYRELLKFDVNNLSKEELRLKISKMYYDYLSDKPLLSENEQIKKIVNEV